MTQSQNKKRKLSGQIIEKTLLSYKVNTGGIDFVGYNVYLLKNGEIVLSGGTISDLAAELRKRRKAVRYDLENLLEQNDEIGKIADYFDINIPKIEIDVLVTKKRSTSPPLATSRIPIQIQAVNEWYGEEKTLSEGIYHSSQEPIVFTKDEEACYSLSEQAKTCMKYEANPHDRRPIGRPVSCLSTDDRKR